MAATSASKPVWRGPEFLAPWAIEGLAPASSLVMGQPNPADSRNMGLYKQKGIMGSLLLLLCNRNRLPPKAMKIGATLNICTYIHTSNENVL
jgi:hypothetical protein